MLVKSEVVVNLNVSADVERLEDGTLVITRPRLVKEIGIESGADFLGLPEDVRKAALVALSRDAREFIKDMQMVDALGARK